MVSLGANWKTDAGKKRLGSKRRGQEPIEK